MNRLRGTYADRQAADVRRPDPRHSLLVGKVNVNRGCGGQVSSWGFGQGECDIMSADALQDTGVALYQCRGDLCNNIEPADGASQAASGGDVVLMTGAVRDQGSSASVKSSASSSSASSSSDDNSADDSSDDIGDSSAKTSYGGPSTTLKRIVTQTQSSKKVNQGGYGNQEILPSDEDQATVKLTKKRLVVTPKPTTEKRIVVPQTSPDVDDETDAPAYQERRTTTTTTTTTKKRRVAYPENEVEVKEVLVPEVTLRPARRGRTVFDRRK